MNSEHEELLRVSEMFLDVGEMYLAAVDRVRVVEQELAALRKQHSDQARELGRAQGKAEMWQRRAEAAERREQLSGDLIALIAALDNQDYAAIGDVSFVRDYTGKWTVWKSGAVNHVDPEAGDENCEDAMEFDDWRSAYLAAVKVGWIKTSGEKGEPTP